MPETSFPARAMNQQEYLKKQLLVGDYSYKSCTQLKLLCESEA